MKHMRKTQFVAPLVVVLMLFAGSAKADLVFNLDFAWNGDSPSGAAPWLTATFSTVTTDVVRLLLEGNLHDPEEYLNGSFGWGFNIDPSLEGALNAGGDDAIVQDFSAGSHDSDPPANITIAAGNEMGGHMKADGEGGYFDFRFQWTNSSGPDRFDGINVALFTITAAGITEGSFDFGSSQAGAGGPYFTVAEVQGISDPVGGSGWIGTQIPAPGAVVLGAMGLGLVGWLKRRVT